MNVSNFAPPRPQLWQEEITFAQQTVAALPAGSTIVEIGSAQGGGLHLMAAARQWPDRITISSFDPYPGDEVRGVCKMHPQVFSHACLSEQGSLNWANLGGGPVDLLVIDGSHTLAAVCNDYDSWRKWLSPRSEVLFHDYDPRRREGASHPAVKVFCDALLLISGHDSKKDHVGRYLLVRTPDAREVTIENLKQAARDWLGYALKGAAGLQRRFKSKTLSFGEIVAGHSRLSASKTGPIAPGAVDNTDTEIVLFLAYEVPGLHEMLIHSLPDPLHVLKWLEYLEMFLHAREWSLNRTAGPVIHPILAAIDDCKSIPDLSRFCGDIAVLIGLVECTFDSARTKSQAVAVNEE
jgi:hypothetical protein